MDCSSIIDNIANYLNKPTQPHYITAIYEDSPLSYLLPNNNLKLNRTLYFNDLKELLYFPDKKSIKRLDLSNQNISDINFLYEFRNIESLNLSNNSIRDISQLQHLFKLKKLNLSNNNLNNLNYLDRCINLEQINLSQNNINNLCELRSLSELKILDITQTQVNNLEDLDELKKLEYIYLSDSVNTSNINKKLKNKIKIGNNMIITSYLIWFNKIYKSQDGFRYKPLD